MVIDRIRPQSAPGRLQRKRRRVETPPTLQIDDTAGQSAQPTDEDSVSVLSDGSEQTDGRPSPGPEALQDANTRQHLRIDPSLPHGPPNDPSAPRAYVAPPDAEQLGTPTQQAAPPVLQGEATPPTQSPHEMSQHRRFWGQEGPISPSPSGDSGSEASSPTTDALALQNPIVLDFGDDTPLSPGTSPPDSPRVSD